MGGVVAGVLATGGTNFLVEMAKSRNRSAKALRDANQVRCETFLAVIEADARATWGHYEQHGVMPGDAGYEEETSKARLQLTELELYCPTKVHGAAVELVNQLEGWAFGGKASGAYEAAREAFVKAFKDNL